MKITGNLELNGMQRYLIKLIKLISDYEFSYVSQGEAITPIL